MSRFRLNRDELRELRWLADCAPGYGWFVTAADHACARPLDAKLVEVGNGMIWITDAGRTAVMSGWADKP